MLLKTLFSNLFFIFFINIIVIYLQNYFLCSVQGYRGGHDMFYSSHMSHWNLKSGADLLTSMGECCGHAL